MGGLGFFLGGAGGAAVGALGGGIGGTLMGACTAAQVGVDKGILTPEQQTALIDATAESLRATYADLLAQLQLPEEERLTAANCPRLIERFKPQPAGSPDMDWPALLAFWAAFALALVSPGPNFALMLRVGLGSGRAVALRTALGHRASARRSGALPPCSASRRWPCAIPLLGTAIRWAGGAFLLWLALGALRSAWRGSGRGRRPAARRRRRVLDGARPDAAQRQGRVLLGVADRRPARVPTSPPPRPCSPWRRRPAVARPGTAVLALAFSGRRLTRLYARARRGIEGVLGAVLAGLGVRLLAASWAAGPPRAELNC